MSGKPSAMSFVRNFASWKKAPVPNGHSLWRRSSGKGEALAGRPVNIHLHRPERAADAAAITLEGAMNFMTMTLSSRNWAAR
jgi:hypothetical protein